MIRHKWTAWQKGRIIDDGVIEAATERDGIRDLLSSRAWPGHDWRLRVGGASMTFDEEDVAKLAEEVADEHAKDEVLAGPVPKEIVQAAVDAVIRNKVRPEKQLGQLTDKSVADSYVIDNAFWDSPSVAETMEGDFDKIILKSNQVFAGIDTPCCGAGVGISVDVVEPLKSRPIMRCPVCHKRYELQVTGLLLGGSVSGSGVRVQGVFHPDVRPASTVITQAFAQMGLPAGAEFYALRKIGTVSENVLGVRASGDDVFVEFIKYNPQRSVVCHFTHAELKSAW